VFNRPDPIVDGNVARILIRIEGRDLASDEGLPWAWERASEFVVQTDPTKPGATPAAFNEGLMELGAVVCIPRSPRCDRCPIRADCRAFAEGRQNELPRPKKVATRRPMFCATVLIEHKGRLLVERRPDTGMWAGMWQAPTLESGRRASRAAIESWIGTRV